ncbi:MAG: hypothetical protein R3C99_07900 [Pirellulaceae bacterium]
MAEFGLSQMSVGLAAPTVVPQIGQLLEPYGYGEAKLEEGRTLLNTAENLVQRQKVEYGQQYEATAEFKNAWAAARQAYSPTLTLARVAFKKQPDAQAALMLRGSRKETLSGWVEQAKSLYKNLLANPAWLSAMSVLNRSEATLTAERELVESLEAMNHLQEKEKGEAQEATRARDEALEALYDWYEDYANIASIALAGHPEWIEMIRRGAVK